jgi:hypothetical protein
MEANMERPDLDRIRFVTRHFHDLQGLHSLVPLGLITLGAAGALSLGSGPLLLVPAVSFLGALLLMLGARRYYGNTFGLVEPQPVQPTAELSPVSIFNPAGPTQIYRPPITSAQQHSIILGLVPIVFALFKFLFAPPWIRFPSGALTFVSLSWPAFGPAFTPVLYALSGSLFLGIWLLRERHLSQSCHLGLAALLLGLSAFGPYVLWVALLFCGSSLVLAGLLDHWQLVRALGRTTVSQEEES